VADSDINTLTRCWLVVDGVGALALVWRDLVGMWSALS
jgi:hypothetical protein